MRKTSEMKYRKKSHVKIRRVRILPVMIALSTVAALLATAFCFAWFLSGTNVPGTVLKTGKVHVEFSSYKRHNNELTQYISSDVDDPDSVDMISALTQDVALFTSTELDEKDDVYFVIEKMQDSIPLDLSISFAIESAATGEMIVLPQETLTYLSGFAFQLEKVTDAVLNSQATAIPYVNLYNGGSKAPTNIEKKLFTYTSNAGSNSGEARNMSNISRIFPENQADDLRTKDYCIYRLTTYITDVSNAMQYANLEFAIRVDLSVGQQGSILASSSNVYDIADLDDLNYALEDYHPGDTFNFIGNVEYNGDIVIRQPINILMNSSVLTVNGNLLFSYSYSGNFLLDTTGGGQVIVNTTAGVMGGNLEIDLAKATMFIRGSHGVDYSGAPDIVIGREFRIVNTRFPAATEYTNADYSDDLSTGYVYGVTIDKTQIRRGETAQSPLADVYIGNKSKVSIEEDTLTGPMRALADAEFIYILNHGTIVGNVDLRLMRQITAQQSMPQIFIDNYHEISSDIKLPTWSVKFRAAFDEQNHIIGYTGNTRIIREFGADAMHISEDSGCTFVDSDIETMSDYVIDVFSDGTYLIVNYYNYGMNLDQIFYSPAELGFEGFFSQNPGKHIDMVTHMEITNPEGSSATVLRNREQPGGGYEALYTTLRPAHNDMIDDYVIIRDFVNVETLDLHGTKVSGDGDSAAIPNEAFKGMEHLEKITLPDNTVTLMSGAFVNTRVIDLYLPVNCHLLAEPIEVAFGDQTVNEYPLSNVKYVHVQYENGTDILSELMEDQTRYVFVKNSVLEHYRTSYGSAISYVFREATLSNDKNYFCEIFADNTARLAVYVNSEISSSFNYAFLNGNTANPIIQFDDYCFYNNPIRVDTNISFSDRLMTIGDYAFSGEDYAYNNGTTINGYSIGIKSITCSSPYLTRIGHFAFAGCSNLQSVFVDGSEFADFGTRPFDACLSLHQATVHHVAQIHTDTFRTTADNEPLPLTALMLENINTVESAAFKDFDTLMNVSMNSVLSLESEAFMDCDRINEIDMPGTQSVFDSCFESCDTLVVAIGRDVLTVGCKAFYGCADLEIASFPKMIDTPNTAVVNGVTGIYAFANSPKLMLAETSIPSGFCKNLFSHDQTDLRLWIIHSENVTTRAQESLPDGFAACVSEAQQLSVLIGNDYFNSLKNSSQCGEKAVNVGSGYSYGWLNATEDEEHLQVWRNHNKRLADYGFGDYLYATYSGNSTATIYRCLVQEITGVYSIPQSNLTPTGYSSVNLGSLSFQYLDHGVTASILDGTPKLILPETVTAIQDRAFQHCGLDEIQGDYVTGLGYRAFFDSPNLVVAKFIRNNEIIKQIDINSSASNNSPSNAHVFEKCTKLAVLEAGVWTAGGASNSPGALAYGILNDCSSFRYLIVHTEYTNGYDNNVKAKYNFYRDLFFSQTNYRDYRIYVPGYTVYQNGNSYRFRNFYADIANATGITLDTNGILLDTGGRSAENYVYADETDGYAIRYTIADGYHLSDIGYGDYLCCSLGANNATLIYPFFVGDRIYGKLNDDENGYVYSVPFYTNNGMEINSIGASTYASGLHDYTSECGPFKNITFTANNAAMNYEIRIGDMLTEHRINVTGNHCFESSTAYPKNVTDVTIYGSVEGQYNFKNCSKLKNFLFEGYNRGDGGSAGQMTFEGCGALETIEIHNPFEPFDATNLFGSTTPNNQLRVKVLNNIYEEYLLKAEQEAHGAIPPRWGGICAWIDDYHQGGSTHTLYPAHAHFKLLGYYCHSPVAGQENIIFFFEDYASNVPRVEIDGYNITKVGGEFPQGVTLDQLVIPDMLIPENVLLYPDNYAHPEDYLKPVYAISDGAFKPFARSTESNEPNVDFRSLRLPCCLKTFAYTNIWYMPPSFSAYVIPSMSSTENAIYPSVSHARPSTVADITAQYSESAFRSYQGILVSAQYDTLVNVPRGMAQFGGDVPGEFTLTLAELACAYQEEFGTPPSVMKELKLTSYAFSRIELSAIHLDLTYSGRQTVMANGRPVTIDLIGGGILTLSEGSVSNSDTLNTITVSNCSQLDVWDVAFSRVPNLTSLYLSNYSGEDICGNFYCTDLFMERQYGFSIFVPRSSLYNFINGTYFDPMLKDYIQPYDG